MTEVETSEFVRHIPCPSCGSSDANSLYTDNHQHCFSCGYHTKGDSDDHRNVQETKPVAEALKAYFGAEVTALPARGITEETCRRYGYRVGRVDGKSAHLAPYYRNNQVVGCKVRDASKNFKTLGDMKAPEFFGQHLQGSGKMLVVTEGEIDCLTVSQVQGNKWPVVSLPSGAPSAAKAFKNNLDFLLGFETVVIMFDMDEPGQKAAKECAELLPPGKAKIAHLNAKDPNELLLANRSKEIISAIWDAKPYRPDGIVTIADIKQKALTPPSMGLAWFLESLTKATYGRREGEIYCFGAGTGVGKTDILIQQIEYDINTLNEKVGVFFLEQSPAETLQRVAGKEKGKLFHIPDGKTTTEELAEALDVLEKKNRLFLYDSWGSTEWEAIRNKIRYLSHAEGIRLFYIDHLTALAAMADDEKKALEQIMAEMAGLAQELGIIIHLVSHLATPEGKAHEEGGRVLIKQFKGSRAIGFWCHFMFGIERDQQDAENRNRSVFRVLKDRNTGRATGLCIPLNYNSETGLISESPFTPEGAGEKYDF
jgi:twinkle protein